MIKLIISGNKNGMLFNKEIYRSEYFLITKNQMKVNGWRKCENNSTNFK